MSRMDWTQGLGRMVAVLVGGLLASGCGEPVGMRLVATPAVACPGSQVELRWIGDSDATFTLHHADGSTESVKPDDARTVEASQVSAILLEATATFRTRTEKGFTFQLVEGTQSIPVQANAFCQDLKQFEGVAGISAQHAISLDPALVVSQLHLHSQRHLMSVEHAGLRADMPSGQWLTTSFEGTAANGLWTFNSPLGVRESCDPKAEDGRLPPAGLSAELIVTCGGN